MDFLTRLAQRMTGELPAVQPRLASIFEPAAGPAAATSEGMETIVSPQSAGPALSGMFATHRGPAMTRGPVAALPGYQDASPSVGPPDSPASVTRRVVPSTSSRALAEAVDLPTSLTDVAPARTSIEAAPELAGPRRVVPVDIRPAGVGAAHPAPSGSRQRNGSTAPMRAEIQPMQSSVAVATPEGPATVHVHIGRVDVRAVMAATPASPPRQTPRPAPSHRSLEDYLSGGKGGSQP
jgi:hypothetical protein